jgi:hypothetical protein
MMNSCPNIPLEEMQLSDYCKDKLKSAGFTSAQEIAEFLIETWKGAMVTITWGDCVDVTIEQLREIGCLGEDD